jgi:thiol-disulfide isomerase/thioredoxin
MTTLIALSIFAGTQSAGFTNWQSALASKESLSAKVTVQEIGGASSTYSIDLKKPNFVRIDKGDELVVADGTNITTFVKKEGIFYKRPQTKDDVRVILDDDQFMLFSGFFGDAPKAFSSSDGSTRALGGEQVKEVKAIFDKKGNKEQLFFVGADGLAKRANLTAKRKQDPKPIQFVTIAKDVVVNGTSSEALYAFKAPAGAKEIDYNDLIASKWFYDLEEAKLIASKTGKMVFIDFMASWCGPCKMMAADAFDTQEFKALGKKLVFCKIDIDLNPALAEQYNVTAIPNVFVIKPDGTVVGSILGYGGLGAFMDDLTRIVESGS